MGLDQHFSKNPEEYGDWGGGGYGGEGREKMSLGLGQEGRVLRSGVTAIPFLSTYPREMKMFVQAKS